MTIFDLSCFQKNKDINLEDLTVKDGYNDQEKWNLAEKATAKIYEFNKEQYEIKYTQFSLKTFLLPKVQEIIDNKESFPIEATFLMDIDNDKKPTLQFLNIKTFQYVDFTENETEKIKHLIKLFYDRYAERNLCAIYVPNLAKSFMSEGWLISMIPILLKYIPKEYKYVYSLTYDPKNIYIQLQKGLSKYNEGYVNVFTEIGRILIERAEELYKLGYIKLGKEEYYENVKEVVENWKLEIVDMKEERLYDDSVVEKCCRYYRPTWTDRNITNDPVEFIYQRITGYDYISFYVPSDYTIKHFAYKLLQETKYIPLDFVEDGLTEGSSYFGNSFLNLPVTNLDSAREISTIIEYAITMSEGFNLVIPFDHQKIGYEIYEKISRDIPDVNFCFYLDKSVSYVSLYEKGPYILSAIIGKNLDINRIKHEIREYILKEYHTSGDEFDVEFIEEPKGKIRSPKMLEAPKVRDKSSPKMRKIYQEDLFPRERIKIKRGRNTRSPKQYKREMRI